MTIPPPRFSRRRQRASRLAGGISPVIESLEQRTLLSVNLVKDINPSPTGVQEPSAIVDVNGTLFISVGGQLWKSDGTVPGTIQVSPLQLYPGSMTNVGGTLYFLSGGGLWKSDGTAGGTVQLSSVSGVAGMTDVNGVLYFRASDGAGSELWRSDGTSAGTARLKDINPGSAGSDPRSLTNVNGQLYFHASDGSTGDELWTSDGTAAGTVRVKDINLGASGSEPLSLTNVNGTLFFIAHNADDSGYELWKSDGTPGGTIQVKDIRPGLPGSSPTMLTSVNDKLMFCATDGQNGYELWTSDGTAGGTMMVKDIIPGGASPVLDNFTAVGTNLFFSADDGSGQELWKSDGTAAGTARVKDIAPGVNTSEPGGFVAMPNGKLFFTANDGTTGWEPWISDGTTAGTTLLSETFPGTFAPPEVDPTLSGGKVYFITDFGPESALWVSDGTGAGTQKFKTFDIASIVGSNPSDGVRVNNTVFFSADDGIHGRELWKTDGSTGGTSMVTDLRPGIAGSNPSELTSFNNALYFSYNGQLYTSDGSAAGTVAVSTTAMGPSKLTPAGSQLFFTGSDGGGTELWKSDGTAAGTNRVKDIRIGAASSSPDSLTNVNGTLMFVADDGNTGYEIWKSDGTSAGTTQIKDIRPGSTTSGPALLTNVNGTLFFRASDGSNGYELWKSDGTSGGTSMVKDIRPGSGDAYIRSLTAYGSALLFVADDGVHGEELWTSDGTTLGTNLLSDIHAGANGSTPAYLMNVGSTFFFKADDGVHGEELWTTDGTPAGTVMVKDVHPGATGSNIMRMFNVEGTLLFFASEQSYMDVWTSDGTAAGTYSLNFPGNHITPNWVTKLNGVIYMDSWTQFNGWELFSMTLDRPDAAIANTTAGTQAAAAAQTANIAAQTGALSAGDVFYDGVGRSDKPQSVAGSGLAGIKIIGGEVRSDWYFEYPDEGRTREMARQAAAAGQPLIIDIEHWSLDNRALPESLVQMDLERLEHVIDWAHAEQPGLAVGFYGLIPVDANPAPAAGSPAYAAWHAASERVKPLIDRADMLLPVLYTQTGSPSAWQADAEAKIAESLSYGKIVRPFYWMQYFGYPQNTAPRSLPGTYWRQQLDLGKDLADGGVLWDAGGPWQENAPWWTITRDFLIDSTPTIAATPTNLSTTTVSSVRIDLDWKDNAYNETGYRIERRIGSAGPFDPVTTVGRNVTHYSDTGLSGGVEYKYRVVAVNAAGDSVASNESSSTTADVFPLAPTNLNAAPLSTSRVQLNWTDASFNEQGFAIERAIGNGAFAQIDTVGTDVATFTDTGLSAGAAYRYRIRSFNAAGYSPYTSESPATTLLTNSNLLAHWQLDEGTGTSTADAAGGNHGGTLVGGPVWTTGVFGPALSFDGIDDRVVIPDSPSLRFTSSQDFTISAWVYLPALPNKFSAVVEKSWGVGDSYYGIELDDTNHWVFSGPASIVGSTATTGWTLVTAVQDFAAGGRKLYVNGALVATGSVREGSGTGALYIGSTGYANFGGYFAGRVDDVRIYARALPAAETAALADPHVVLPGTPANDHWTVRLNPTGSDYEFLLDNVVSFTRPVDSVATLDFAAGSGNDSLTLDFTNGDPLPAYGFTFDGGLGSDTLQLQGGGPSLALVADASHVTHGTATLTYTNIDAIGLTAATLTATADLATNLTVNNQGVAIFTTTQHLPSLTLAAGGLARLAPGADKALVTPSLSISPTASLDLRDNKLILPSASPGSWTGSSYTGIAGMIRTGHNGGAWNGLGGILTTDPRASTTDGNTAAATLALAKVSSVRNIADNETTLFAGQTVLGSDTIVMFTWAGDATLDGKINIDDYVRIDAAINIGATGYANGDINYDGKVNIDDYLLIDTNIATQGTQFSTTSPFTAAALVSASTPLSAPRSVWIPRNRDDANNGDVKKDDDASLI